MSTIPKTQEEIEKMIGERYRIVSLAGNGGFGDVYRAYDNRMSRDVAVKVVRSLGDKEAKVLTGIEHRGMPKLYDVIRGGDVTVMIMEWIPGVDLEKYIRAKGTLSEKTVVRMGLEILEILDYLHTHSPAIIYQDLKPSNIMIMPDGHVKLVDFGTALVMDYGDEETILAGTVGYGAPEQRGITAIRHATCLSDLYAWGAVMYTMLSGIMLNKPPYTMKKIRTVCPGVSYGLSHVISKCTRRNEKDRFADAKSVIRALNHRNLINLVTKSTFTVLFASCVIPFVLIWFSFYIDGDFGFMERKLKTIRWLMYTGNELKAQNLRRTLIYTLKSDELLKDIGYMALTGAWMFTGIRFIQSRKFIRIKRSIFLSHRKYPGLWVPTLMAGLILGCGIGGSLTTVSEAKEAETSEVVKITDRRENTPILPISFVDQNGNNMILRYDAPFDVSKDMCMKIDSDFISDYGEGVVMVTIISSDRTRKASRSIPLSFFANSCE